MIDKEISFLGLSKINNSKALYLDQLSIFLFKRHKVLTLKYYI
jgi:hypothetical protein